MRSLDESRACSVCARSFRCRFECADCHIVLCFGCGGRPDTRRKWHEDHQAQNTLHRNLWHITLPNFSVPDSVPKDCHCVEDPDAMQHCDRCFKCMSCPCNVNISDLLSTYTRRRLLFMLDLQKSIWRSCENVQRLPPSRAWSA